MRVVHVRFLSHGDTTPDRFEKAVVKLPEVLPCHKVTGDADCLLRVLAADLDSYGDFVERVLRKQPDVAPIPSSLALREVKSTSHVPVPDDLTQPARRGDVFELRFE